MCDEKKSLENAEMGEVGGGSTDSEHRLKRDGLFTSGITCPKCSSTRVTVESGGVVKHCTCRDCGYFFFDLGCEDHSDGRNGPLF